MYIEKKRDIFVHAFVLSNFLGLDLESDSVEIHDREHGTHND